MAAWRWCVPLLLMTVAALPLAAPPAPQGAIETVPVKDGLHMLVGRGGNIGVLAGEDGLLMIDDKFADLGAPIQEALDALGQGQLQYLLNTHFHGDHTGSNPRFGARVPVIAHDNVRARLLKGDGSGPMAREGLPDITFDDDLTLHFNGQTIRLRHYPEAHTDGDMVVRFEEANVVHLGDLMFHDAFPYVDLGSGGNALNYAAAVQDLLDTLPEDVTIIPGHGALATYPDLERFHAMLTECIAVVRGYKEAGQSLEEAQANGVPDTYAGWGDGFVNEARWVGILYGSLD